jgi:hypothetical protein
MKGEAAALSVRAQRCQSHYFLPHHVQTFKSVNVKKFEIKMIIVEDFKNTNMMEKTAICQLTA